MAEKKRKGPDRERLLKSLAAGFVIAALVFALGMSRSYGAARAVCDGFFVAAAMLLGVGGIMAVRNKGAFDVSGYGLRAAINQALPMLRREKETMDEYRRRKADERKSSTELLAAGGIYLFLSVLALIVYELIV